MRIILGPPRSGKTTKLVRLSAASGAPIVTRDVRQVSKVLNLAQRLNLTIPKPMTYDEFLKRDYTTATFRSVLVDDVEALVLRLSKVQVDALTVGTAGDFEYLRR